ncbi:MAG: SRPBCC family protein [Saprospiraceae bacterium]
MKTQRTPPVQQFRELLITASAEQVWQVLTDINNWVYWHNEITAAQLHDSLQTGSSFTYTYNKTTIKARIQTLEMCRQFQFIGKAYGVTALSTWVLKPMETGVLVQNKEQMWGLIPILLKRTFNKNLGKGIERWLQKLQQQVNKNEILEQRKNESILTSN